MGQFAPVEPALDQAERDGEPRKHDLDDVLTQEIDAVATERRACRDNADRDHDHHGGFENLGPRLAAGERPEAVDEVPAADCCDRQLHGGDECGELQKPDGPSAA